MKNMLSLEAFADWCETQPPEETYNFIDASDCAAARYLKSIGVYPYVLYSDQLPKGWGACLNPDGPHSVCTYGQLAQRLRKASARG